MAVFSVNGREEHVSEAIEKLLWVDPYCGGSMEQTAAKVEKLEKLIVQLAIAYATTAQKLNRLTQYDFSYQYEDIK